MVSKFKSRLVSVGEAIKSLIFPFKYEFIYVPFLPDTLIDYLYLIHLNNHAFRNAPVPFLMGIEDKMLNEAHENIGDGTYIIDLDNDKVMIIKAYDLSILFYRLLLNKKHQ